MIVKKVNNNTTPLQRSGYKATAETLKKNRISLEKTNGMTIIMENYYFSSAAGED